MTGHAPTKVRLEWFTRNIAEMGDKTAAWLVTPMMTLMSVDFMLSDPSRLILVDTDVLTGHNVDHAMVHDNMPEMVLTIPPMQVELSTPEGPRAFLVDGNNRVKILAARGVKRIPVYHMEEALADRLRFTDEEAIILADESGAPDILEARNAILTNKAHSLNDIAENAQNLLNRSPFSTFPLPRPLIGLVTPADLANVEQQRKSGRPLTFSHTHLEQVLRRSGRKFTVNHNPLNRSATTSSAAPRKVPAWEAAKARKKARKKK